MEFKGTKGKWELAENKRKVHVNVKPTVYKTICSSHYNTKWQYDMLLISKAPDMLEMLKRFVESENTPLVLRKMSEQLIKEATEL